MSNVKGHMPLDTTKKPDNWYRAHFMSGTLDFQAKNLADARQQLKELAAQHYPKEPCYSLGAVGVSTPEGTRNKKKIPRR